MEEYRTHYCDSITLDDVGKKVRIAGFVETIRDFGGLVFLDIRDMYGITQVVTSADSRDVDVVSHIPIQSVVTVYGLVRKRSEDTINLKLKTGEVEIYIEEISVLSKRTKDLPFEINGTTKIREELRLKYRYLDLRSDKLRENLKLRARIIQFLREKMIKKDFLEVQTPILTASSPEGARDYLVPSRLHKGKFYALPQAPQQFKQLLMVSGIDKYFQIAPCFRDEDSRADRVPGEFYQLDIEMAYATQEDVFEIMEKVIYETFSKFSCKKIKKYPFRRIKYSDSMEKYGSDKPDLRNPLEIIDVTDLFKNIPLKAFAGQFVRIISTHDVKDKPRSFFEGMTEYAVKELKAKGLAWLRIMDDLSLQGPIAKFIPEKEKMEMIKRTKSKEGDCLFFIADYAGVVDKLAGSVRTELGRRLELIDENKLEFCWITDFPMYEYDERHKLTFCHNPFSMPKGSIDVSDPLSIMAYQYDLVCNGIELASGAVRNNDPDLMVKVFEKVGYTKEYIVEKFGAMFEAFQYGAPPHAGIAPGIDRMLMLLTESETIREVIAFPLSGKAEDLMMKAPSIPSKEQLAELKLTILKV
jgi:aspartyl-tRNA synthetase